MLVAEALNGLTRLPVIITSSFFTWAPCGQPKASGNDCNL